MRYLWRMKRPNGSRAAESPVTRDTSVQAPTGIDSPARRDKAAEMLARRIEADLRKRKWPVGKNLGSEPDLIERFGVSRAVLRETVRILEHHNVAEMRRGPNGGLIVRAPDAGAVTTAAAIYLNYREVEPLQLLATRSVLELKCVELAASRLDEAGMARLRDFIEAEAAADLNTMAHGGQDLHLLIAELAEDPTIRLFVAVLIQLQEELSPPEDVPDAQFAEHLLEVKDDHAGIVEAMLVGDAATARLRMLKHLEKITGYLEGYRRDLEARPTEGGAATLDVPEHRASTTTMKPGATRKVTGRAVAR
jgi:DNA-binding FadR family transcriptional regulator